MGLHVTLAKHYASFVCFRTIIKQFVFYRPRKGGIDQAIVDAIDRDINCRYPTCCDVQKPVVSKQQCVWIKLPFHPAYAPAFDGSVSALCSDSVSKKPAELC